MILHAIVVPDPDADTADGILLLGTSKRKKRQDATTTSRLYDDADYVWGVKEKLIDFFFSVLVKAVRFD